MHIVKVHFLFAKLTRSIAIFSLIFNDWFCVNFFRKLSDSSTERCESGFSRRLIRLWRRIGQFGKLKNLLWYGEVREWLNRAVSKTVDPLCGSVGSNPTLSARMQG